MDWLLAYVRISNSKWDINQETTVKGFGVFIILSLETSTLKNCEDSVYSIRTRIHSKMIPYSYLEKDSKIFYQSAGVEAICLLCVLVYYV